MSDPLTLPTWRDQAAGLSLALCFGLLLFYTLPETGIPRDESFYLHAADRAAGWVQAVFDDEREALSEAEIKKGFEYNREHPVLMKLLFGVSHLLLKERWDLTERHLTAYRLPTVVLSALSVWLTFLLGVMIRGRLVGLIAAVALMWLPRQFLHSHLACFDAPVAFMWLLVCYTYLRAARSRAWAIVAGLCFGLGLATKLNVFFVPFVLGCVAALDCWAYKRRTGAWRASAGEAPGPLTYYSWLAVALPVLGLAVFWAHWPWLWSHTIERVRFYVSFHARHVHYPVDYLGHLYFKPPFPVHFPFVYTLLSTPIATLVLGGIGLWQLARRALRELLDGQAAGRRSAELMVLANFLAPIAIIAMPSTPIFGGIKHWMAAMPFLALAAGIGAERIGLGLFAKLTPLRRALATAMLTGAMLIPAARATLKAHPHGETWFNPIAGGRAGAARLGMPRNFWGYSTIGVLDVINKRAEPRAYVFWHKLTRWGFDAYRRDGLIRKDLRYTGDWTAEYSDWGVYHDQREKLPEELDLWRAYGTDWPVAGLFLGGVQVMAVYHRPEPPAPPPRPEGAR